MILDIEKKPRVNHAQKGPSGKPMVCEQNGLYASSMVAMALAMKISYPLMAKFMAGKCKHAKGYTFRYATVEEIKEATK